MEVPNQNNEVDYIDDGHEVNDNDIDYNRKSCVDMATIVSFISLLFIIANIFLAGFQYNQADQRWSHEGGYFILGVLEIIYVVIAFVITLIGIIILICCQKNFNTIRCVRILFNS